MKKYTLSAIILLIGLGVGLVFNQSSQASTYTRNHIHTNSNTKDRAFIWGKVDFSDDDDIDDTDTKEDDDNWFEKFIKNHKTPFSKVIHK